MVDTRISALTAVASVAAANELAVNEAGTSKKATAQQIAEYIFKRIAGSSGAAGDYITIQNLTADSADITSTTPSVVMTTTLVGVGTWKFKYTFIYQTAATTTGIGAAVNHTGTVTQFASHLKQVNTLATASNGIGEDLVSAAAGLIYEARPELAKDTVTFKTVGVGNINTDILAVLEGLIVVTVTGSLELKVSTEVASSAVRIMADSMLELIKVE